MSEHRPGNYTTHARIDETRTGLAEAAIYRNFARFQSPELKQQFGHLSAQEGELGGVS